MAKAKASRGLEDRDYRALARWRHALRRFLAASEQITRARGVSATQYQLLLFIRGQRRGPRRSRTSPSGCRCATRAQSGSWIAA